MLSSWRARSPSIAPPPLQPQQEPAGIGRHPARHLDQTEVAVDVRPLARLGDAAAPLRAASGPSTRPRTRRSAAAVNRWPGAVVRCAPAQRPARRPARRPRASAAAHVGGLFECRRPRRWSPRSPRAVPGAPIGVDLSVETLASARWRPVVWRAARSIDGRADEWMAELEPASRTCTSPACSALSSASVAGPQAARPRAAQSRVAAVVRRRDEQERLRSSGSRRTRARKARRRAGADR